MEGIILLSGEEDGCSVAASDPGIHRPALGTERALEEIARGDGTLYDPRVMGVCLEAFTDNNFKFEE
jgi:hypothetical protein